MNIGQKLISIRNNLGYKNFAEFGKSIGVSGDWMLDLSKKDTLQMVDISRLIKLADSVGMTLDELLRDCDGNYIIDTKQSLPENDILLMLDKIKDNLYEGCTFNGVIINKETIKLIEDLLDITKSVINQNI